MADNVIIESPRGVFRLNKTIVKVTQEAINNFDGDFWGDATEIAAEAFSGLDLSPLSVRRGQIWGSVTKPYSRKSGMQGVPQETVRIYSDLYIPARIEKIGDRAFKGCKGVEVIQIAKRTFNELGNEGHGYGAKYIGEEAFANIKGLKAVFVGQKSDEVEICKNAFAGNDFCNEFRHYTLKFGGHANGLWGFSSVENIDEHLPSLNSSVRIDVIPNKLIESDKSVKNSKPRNTGIADMIER